MPKKLIFLSNAYEQNAIAAAYSEIFKSMGYKCWLKTEIRFGEDSIEKTYEAFNKSFIVLLIITKDYIESDDCLQIAFEAAKAKKYTIPILFGNKNELEWPIPVLEDYYPKTTTFARYPNLLERIQSNKNNVKDVLAKDRVTEELLEQLNYLYCKPKAKEQAKLKLIVLYNEHENVVSTFCGFLKSKGFDCWFDKERVHFGEETIRKTSEAMGECDVILMIITQKFIQSSECLSLAFQAVQQKKQTIPILLGNKNELKWPIPELERHYPKTTVYARYPDLMEKIEANRNRMKETIIQHDVTEKLISQLKSIPVPKRRDTDDDPDSKIYETNTFSKVMTGIYIATMVVRLAMEIAAFALINTSKCDNSMLNDYVNANATIQIVLALIYFIIVVVPKTSNTRTFAQVCGLVLNATIGIIGILSFIAGSVLIGLYKSGCSTAVSTFLIGYIVFEWIFTIIVSLLFSLSSMFMFNTKDEFV